MAKLTATHAGQTFTRKTDRTYQFVVVSKPSSEAAYVQRAHENAAFHATPETLAYYRDASSTSYKYASQVSDANRAEYARIVGLGVEGYHAEILARELAYVAGLNASGHFDKFVADNWCGRRDLAEKAAAESRRLGRREVAIIPVNV